MPSSLPYPIPSALRRDQKVVPFMARSQELRKIDFIISYFCKMYVVTYLYDEELNRDDEEIDFFYGNIIEDTEPKYIKDPLAKRVFESKQSTVKYVYDFALKSYDAYIESTKPPGRETSTELAKKLHAAIVDWSLIALFEVGIVGHGNIDYAAATGGLFRSEDELTSFSSNRVKELQRCLSQLT